MELGRLLGFLHPALVHFPLVLLLVSFFLELVGFARRDAQFTWSAQAALLLGTIATLFAFVCGNFAEIWAARDGVPQDPMELHELYATITSWTFVFLAAARIFLGTSNSRRWMPLYLTCMAAGCVLLVITGHKGAMLVIQHAAGVQVGHPPPLPTHEDLAVLQQKQDPDALYYSNNMHHIFGAMVFVFSTLLLVELVSPRLGHRLRAITPLLLLVGGVFLLIFSDTDSWPLSHQRPLMDKEVLMHKTYAALMLIFGAQGLRRRGKRDSALRTAGEQTGDADPISTRKRQGRLMAAFSLIGGALLFTHVHSNAPYANVAVGVYIHHTVMGFIALSIGAVKFAEDYLSRVSPRRPARIAAVAYPCLMLLESIFLLNYNEGLPWFLGYRSLSLSAPHKGLVAPMGDQRAELVYDPETTRLEVFLLHQANDRPYPIAANSITVVVRVGTESTAVTLSATPERGGNSHFTGNAAYLRGVAMFQAQATVKEADSRSSREWKADFEPWTDPQIAVAEHTLAAFVCPMHPAVGAPSPGSCPVCGMALVPNRAARKMGELHDSAYTMDLATAQGANETQPTAGMPVRLKLTLKRAGGGIVTSLETVHTKKLHLIIVSRDLSLFDHVHPEPAADGSLELEYAFPAPGNYVLFADCTPTGDRNQVFALPVTVAGDPPVNRPLDATPAQAKTFGDYRVRLDLSPSPALPRDETQVSFTVSENGVPVTDLEPYLGAGGHCVAISSGAHLYLHSHPLESGLPRAGPTVTFHTIFPAPGLYKIWGQFQHRGKILVADFVVNVP